MPSGKDGGEKPIPLLVKWTNYYYYFPISFSPLSFFAGACPMPWGTTSETTRVHTDTFVVGICCTKYKIHNILLLQHTHFVFVFVFVFDGSCWNANFVVQAASVWHCMLFKAAKPCMSHSSPLHSLITQQQPIYGRTIWSTQRPKHKTWYYFVQQRKQVFSPIQFRPHSTITACRVSVWSPTRHIG